MHQKGAYGTLKTMQISSWQGALRNAIKDPEALFAYLKLPAGSITLARESLTQFPLKVPQPYLDRMEKGNPADPLLRQVLPLQAEEIATPGYTHDPVAELPTQVVPGVLHKYHGRALLIATGACAIHCRYCFRRHFPYGEGNGAKGDWQGALAYLEGQPSISEMILSGGDPLSLSDEKLAALARQLAGIPHLKRLRIHTRMPVVIPARITASFVEIFTRLRLKPVLVIHCNHPNEINAAVQEALKPLTALGMVLLNQSVLLKGVNDDPDVLAQLSEALFDCGVLPYYLHMLDPVAGAAHFDVAEHSAIKLMEELRRQLPGYLVPRLVREVSGLPYKLPIL